mgnify:CR=1 FL=1
MNAIEHSMIKLKESTNLGKFTSIPKKQYERWKRQYIFKALQGESYGTSFCKSFKVVDYILSSTKNIEQCDRYIHSRYIKQS